RRAVRHPPPLDISKGVRSWDIAGHCRIEFRRWLSCPLGCSAETHWREAPRRIKRSGRSAQDSRSGIAMLGYFPSLPYHVAVAWAASGIGRETASFLATQGVSVTCIDRNGTGAEETARGISSTQGKAVAAVADVTDDASIPRALDAAQAALGPIH